MSKKITRRQVLSAAAAAPAVAFLNACTSTGGSKTPAKSARGGRGRKLHPKSRPGQHMLPKFPPSAPGKAEVAKRVKWDFERFVKELVDILKAGKTDNDADLFAEKLPQEIMEPITGKIRNLNVRTNPPVEFVYETREGVEYVTGFKVQCCMARFSGEHGTIPDQPYPFAEGRSCEDAKNGAKRLILTDHLVYSSSSSSSSWPIP